MRNLNTAPALILGTLLSIGLVVLGYAIAGGMVKLKALERTVTVKGLSERDVNADIAIWPITYTEADNDLNALSTTLQTKNALILDFLAKQGFAPADVSIAAPSITDRQAQGFDGSGNIKFRYSGKSTVTVYTHDVDRVRKVTSLLVELGKQGIAVANDDYQGKTSYEFTGLNALKPGMIEEATKNARAVAERFAADSQSRLGKIKAASQGQFSIEDRDAGTPYIKRVRVVSTVEYYLSD